MKKKMQVQGVSDMTKRLAALILSVILCAGILNAGFALADPAAERTLAYTDRVLIRTAGVESVTLYYTRTAEGELVPVINAGYIATVSNISPWPFDFSDGYIPSDPSDLAAHYFYGSVNGEQIQALMMYVWKNEDGYDHWVYETNFMLAPGETAKVFLVGETDLYRDPVPEDYVDAVFNFHTSNVVGEFWVENYCIQMDSDLGEPGYEPLLAAKPPAPSPDGGYGEVWAGTWVSTNGSGDNVTITDNADGTIHVSVFFNRMVSYEATVEAGHYSMLRYTDDDHYISGWLMLTPDGGLALTATVNDSRDGLYEFYNGEEIYTFTPIEKVAVEVGNDGWNGTWCMEEGATYSEMYVTGNLRPGSEISIMIDFCDAFLAHVTQNDGRSVLFEGDDIRGKIEIKGETRTLIVSILDCPDPDITDYFSYGWEYFPCD